MTDTHWLAWAAGIIDGEGCISLGPTSGRVQLILHVGQVDIRMLQKLYSIFGGIIKPMKDHRPRRRAVWRWRVRGDQAAQVLKLILPWLVIKHEQAELALLSRQYMNRNGCNDPEKKAAQLWFASQVRAWKHEPSAEPPGRKESLSELKG